MKLGVMLVLVVCACGNKADDYPIGPGGSPGGGGGDDDTAPIDGSTTTDGGGIVGPRVCLVTDLRFPTANCDMQNAGALTVTLGTKTATTNNDGTFVIETGPGAGQLWQVTGLVNPSLVAYTSSTQYLPAITTNAFGSVEQTSAISHTAGHGSIFIQAFDPTTHAPIANLSATLGGVTPLYSGNDATHWDATPPSGTDGVIWLPEVAIGNVDVVLTKQTLNVTVFGIHVEDGAITFVTANFQ